MFIFFTKFSRSVAKNKVFKNNFEKVHIMDQNFHPQVT